MDNIVYAIFICLMTPLLLSLSLLQRRARLIVGFLLIGSTICLVSSELNGVLYPFFDGMLTFSSTISPIVEEIFKALPVLFFAFMVSDNRTTLVQISFAVGLGFAVMENAVTLVQNLSDINIAWALIRGMGAGLMHGVCTVTVGIGMSMIHKRKKMFVCGTTALLFMAMTYHAIYNTIVMSDYKYFGFALPVITYIPINIVIGRKAKERRRQRALELKQAKMEREEQVDAQEAEQQTE